MSNCAPVLLVDGAGDDVPLDGTVPWLFCPQPAIPNTAATARVRPVITARLRELLARKRLTPHVTDAIGHAQFAPAVPDDRVAVLEEDRLVGAVDGDVVNDVVRDHRVARAHHRYRPAGPQRIDGVPGAVDQQRRSVAVDRLLDALAGDVGVAVLGVPGRRARA